MGSAPLPQRQAANHPADRRAMQLSARSGPAALDERGGAEVSANISLISNACRQVSRSPCPLMTRVLLAAILTHIR
eukprot:4153974-Pyramimonas_sp.AAC.1